MRRVWKAAYIATGVEISLYEGTKHSRATDLLRQGVSERVLQALLGHRDARSTRRYARLADEALVDAIRPRRGSNVDPLRNRPKKQLKNQVVVVEAPGIEPGSEWHPANASTCVASVRSRRGESRQQESRTQPHVVLAPRYGRAALGEPAF